MQQPFDTLLIVARATAAWQKAFVQPHCRCRIVAVTLKANGKRISLPNSRSK